MSRHIRARAKSTRHLSLEPLEDRTLMSTCHVTRLSDGGGGFGLRGDLRYCITKVNNLPGPDVIDFKVSGTITLNSALPDLASEIQIQGPGPYLLTIDAQQKSRVFHVVPSASAQISGLTLTNGLASNKGEGGAVYNEGGLLLENCDISYNTGFIFGGGISNRGTLSVVGCSISHNRVFRNNNTTTWGGGIYSASKATLFVHSSWISNNEAFPELSDTYSNMAIGGGIANLGNAVVIQTTISENIAHPPIWGSWAGAGGGIFNGGELLVHTSLIENNTVSGDFFAGGGAISNGDCPDSGTCTNTPGGNVTIVNSTLADNLAFANGDLGAGYSAGGGISSLNGGTITIRHSTIARNRGDRYKSYVDVYGGGIANDGSDVHMHDTILAANVALTSGNDLYGILAGSGYNLIGDSAGGSGYDPTDLLDVDPKLGDLQYNGGPTKTMALLPGSPAIDSGDNTDAPIWDQRGPGFPRIVNGTIDRGAFEVQATGAPGTTNDLAVLITADFGDSTFESRR